MATYVLPQVQVFQSFTATPTAVANPLPAHIGGGHAWLVRYADAAEQALGELGFYDESLDQDYPWPNLPSGALVDLSYTELFIQDALLKYYETTEGVGSIGGSDDLVKMPGFSNRIVSDVLSFAANGVGFPRSSQFLRDVKPGDIARVRAKDNDDNVHTLWTSVQSVQGVLLSPVVGSASDDIGNADTQSSDSSQSQTAGLSNSLTITAVNDTAYNGLTSGFINETYDLLVTASSIGGDLTTATIRVISGSGTDDQPAISPSASASPTPIGTRGLTVTFTAGVGGDNLVAGQKWHVIVIKAFTEPTATSGGTYTGTANTTYIVQVIKGGLYADSPQISISTTNGVDASGPITITGSNVAAPVGNFGTTIKFTVGTGIRAGDRYYITVTASVAGPMRVLAFTNSFDPSVPDNASCDLELFILNPALQVPQDSASPPALNWSQSATEVTVNAGITATDPSWALDGVPQPLPVVSEADQDYGLVFVQYRAWRADLAGAIFTISDPAQLNTQIAGDLTPDNPLKWGLFNALENNNGVSVAYSAVANPDDPDSWADMLGLLLGRTDIYNLVPLTINPTVLALYEAHINDQSSALQGDWRVGWFNLPGVPEIPIVAAGSDVPNHTAPSTSDGNVALATINGTDNLTLTCTSGNADFQTNGVAAGDIVRAVFTTDGFGNPTYQSFTVASVTSQEVLVLVAGPTMAVNVAAKFEVWRTTTGDQEVAEIIKIVGSYASTRIRAVWPDEITGAGFTFPGYHLCAALGALASGILPQQGMTRLAVAGYTDVSRTTQHFTRAQLDALAGAGVFIVTQDPVSGQVYVRQGVTTAAEQTDPQQREEMFTRNLDSVTFQLMAALAPYIGVANVTPGTLSQVKNTIVSTIETLKSASTTTLGGQVTDGSIVSANADPTFQDRVDVVLTLIMPFALNGIELSLSI